MTKTKFERINADIDNLITIIETAMSKETKEANTLMLKWIYEGIKKIKKVFCEIEPEPEAKEK